MPTFGYTQQGVGAMSIMHRAVATKFTCTQDGVAQSISAYIQRTSTARTIQIKFGIYDASFNMVAETDFYTVPKVIATSLYTLSLTTNPVVIANQTYWLAALATQSGGVVSLINLRYDAGDVNQLGDDDGVLLDLPNPLAPDVYLNRKGSIYCIYTLPLEGIRRIKKRRRLPMRWFIDYSLPTFVMMVVEGQTQFPVNVGLSIVAEETFSSKVGVVVGSNVVLPCGDTKFRYEYKLPIKIRCKKLLLEETIKFLIG